MTFTYWWVKRVYADAGLQHLRVQINFSKFIHDLFLPIVCQANCSFKLTHKQKFESTTGRDACTSEATIMPVYRTWNFLGNNSITKLKNTMRGKRGWKLGWVYLISNYSCWRICEEKFSYVCYLYSCCFWLCNIHTLNDEEPLSGTALWQQKSYMATILLKNRTNFLVLFTLSLFGFGASLFKMTKEHSQKLYFNNKRATWQQYCSQIVNETFLETNQ